MSDTRCSRRAAGNGRRVACAPQRLCAALARARLENLAYAAAAARVEAHRLVHEWSFAHFPDAEHGEWYGWLRRDGSVSSRAKGSMWKGPFHLPRCLWYCWRELDADLRC